jgi:putative salt-induced outer membrane protein YdiY
VLKLRLMLLLSIFVFAFGLNLFADQVTLKNGDRLSGTIEKSDGKTLVIKTEFAGEVTVQFPAIQEIQSTQPLHVDLPNEKSAVGTVTTSDGNLVVTTSSGPVTAPTATVVDLRSVAEQAAYEKTLHPRLTEGWAAGANVGFALTGGNSETENLAIAFTADRKTLHDHIGMYTNSVYGRSTTPSSTTGISTTTTTANTVQGGLRYDRNFAASLFAFGSADFQTDALQTLDLRSVLGGGLGFHAIKNDRTTLDLLGGINYTRENYSGSVAIVSGVSTPVAPITNSFAAATLGEELMHKWGKSTIVTQKLYFFPDFNDAGQYRATFNFGTVTKLNKWLGWQNAFGDIYVTNPPVGKKTDDVLFTTGLNITFTH